MQRNADGKNWLETDGPPARRASPKKTKAWCRGIIGRRHRLVIEIPANASGRGPCGWRWSQIGGEEQWRYSCRHAEICATCKKIFRELWWTGLNDGTGRFSLRPEECPEFTPRPVGTLLPPR